MGMVSTICACCIKRDDEPGIDAAPKSEIPDWSLEQAFWICRKDEEQVFQDKMQLLEEASSLSEAANRLNSGKSTCEDGYCAVKCSKGKLYYCIYRRGSKKDAFAALGFKEGDFSLSAADNSKMHMFGKKVEETAEKMKELRRDNEDLEKENE